MRFRFRWTRDYAIEFVGNYTFQTRSQIEIEVDRYITFPGQACSYKIGELKFKELRNRASSVLGKTFSFTLIDNIIIQLHSLIM